jgi:hemerythrin-like domain-containing protein
MDDTTRLTAFGQQLVQTHIRLREELDLLRAGLQARLDGDPPDPDGARDLRAHCLAFCARVHDHHTDEDGATFPALARRFPPLRPVLDQLEDDHRMVAGMLRRIDELVAGVPADPPPEVLRGVLDELGGLAALLGSHFRFEEKRLVDALDELGRVSP